MNSLSISWILVGIFLWGLPTGLALSFLLGSITLEGGLQIVGLQAEVFARNCAVILPLFIIAGIGLGVAMGRLCERVRHK